MEDWQRSDWWRGSDDEEEENQVRTKGCRSADKSSDLLGLTAGGEESLPILFAAGEEEEDAENFEDLRGEEEPWPPPIESLKT